MILVVLLNFRTPDMTLQAAQAALTAMIDLPAELVIVDNDSGDGSYEALSRAVTSAAWAEGHNIRVIQSGHNGGFGRATMLASVHGLARAPSLTMCIS